MTDSKIKRRWRYYDSVGRFPGTSTYVSDRSGSNDEIHVVVVDEDGGISGDVRKSIRTFSKLSKLVDAKAQSDNDNY